MHSQLTSYFKAEKQQALLFLILGIVAIILGIAGIFYWQGEVWKGISIPLISIAVIQVIVGSTIYFRTDKQLSQLLVKLEAAPEKLVREELPRMQKVNKSFRLYRSIQLLLVFLGLFFVFMGGMGSWGAFIFGTGAGLALQSGIMLTMDLFAAWRAGFYTHKIEQLGRELGVV